MHKLSAYSQESSLGESDNAVAALTAAAKRVETVANLRKKTDAEIVDNPGTLELRNLCISFNSVLSRASDKVEAKKTHAHVLSLCNTFLRSSTTRAELDEANAKKIDKLSAIGRRHRLINAAAAKPKKSAKKLKGVKRVSSV